MMNEVCDLSERGGGRKWRLCGKRGMIIIDTWAVKDKIVSSGEHPHRSLIHKLTALEKSWQSGTFLLYIEHGGNVGD